MRSRTRLRGAALFLAEVAAVVGCATGPRTTPATSAAGPVSEQTGTSTSSEAGIGVDFVLPPSAGPVMDLADVVPDSAERELAVALNLIRTLTEGEIAVVTMRALPGGTPQQLAQRIGNEWGVGARTGRARRAGAVVLVIPKETSTDGRGHCRIELGDGATAFIADSAATAMCEAAIPFFRQRDYAKGLKVIVDALGRRYREALGGTAVGR